MKYTVKSCSLIIVVYSDSRANTSIVALIITSIVAPTIASIVFII